MSNLGETDIEPPSPIIVEKVDIDVESNYTVQSPVDEPQQGLFEDGNYITDVICY